jgi:hypothetical protein
MTDKVNTRIDLHVDRQGNCAGSYQNLGATTEFVIIGNRAWWANDEKGLNASMSSRDTWGPRR